MLFDMKRWNFNNMVRVVPMCPQAVGDRKTLKYERNRQVSPVPKNLHTLYI